ncbi:MAG: PPC domain-containing protein [Aureliella sp.]
MMRLERILAACIALGWVLATSHSARAADTPELTMLFPPGGQVGTSVDVLAQGKFPVWPVKTWTDSPHVQWSCQDETGKLRVEIAPDAELGLHWLRLYESNGATALRPYLIGSSHEASEAEPNDRASQAQSVDQLPFTIQGVLNRRADVDLYAVQLTTGQVLAAAVDSAKWLSSPADISLQILDAQGFVLTENLDHVGLDPYIDFTAPRAGKYLVRLFGFPSAPDSTIAFSGGSDWVYRLQLGIVSAPLSSALDFSRQAELTEPASQLEPGAHTTLSQALPVDVPVRVAGIIAEARQANFVRFSARNGAHYHFSVLARDCGSQLDATLAVLDADGKQLTRIDDVGQVRDPQLAWQAPADGQFVVSISDFHNQGGEHFAYFLQLEERTADFSANIASDLITTSVGKEIEIPINVVRELDYQGPIQVSIEDLPSSVSCAAVESTHGTDTAAKVTLKLTALEAFQGPLRIVVSSAVDTAGSTNPSEATLNATPRQHRVDTGDHKPMWLSITP